VAREVLSVCVEWPYVIRDMAGQSCRWGEPRDNKVRCDERDSRPLSEFLEKQMLQGRPPVNTS
jgi:hypothetical protein